MLGARGCGKRLRGDGGTARAKRSRITQGQKKYLQTQIRVFNLTQLRESCPDKAVRDAVYARAKAEFAKEFKLELTLPQYLSKIGNLISRSGNPVNESPERDTQSSGSSEGPTDKEGDRNRGGARKRRCVQARDETAPSPVQQCGRAESNEDKEGRVQLLCMHTEQRARLKEVSEMLRTVAAKQTRARETIAALLFSSKALLQRLKAEASDGAH